ncbi:MAG: hypothetical protein QM758_06745 [Armatimonas sp.]
MAVTARKSNTEKAEPIDLESWEPELPNLHPGQQAVLDQQRRYNIVCCGRRWGKTLMGQRLTVGPALDGKPVAWFAPDYKALTEVWRELCRMLKEITVRRDSQQHRLELLGDGVIEFWSLDGDPEACRGRKYARVVLDEAAKARHLELAWEQAIRPTLIDYRGDAWFLSTPRGKGDFFHILYKRGQEETAPDWKSWHAPTSSNPTIENLAEELEAARRDTPESVYRQEFEAEFIDAGGLYFDEWVEDKNGAEWHVCTPFGIPAHWPKWGGLDYGKAAPFSFGLHTSSEGHGEPGSWDIYRIDEEYAPGLVPSEQAQRVVGCLRRNGITELRSVLIYADPSIFPPKEPAQRVGEYPAEAFWAAGLRLVPAANARIPGWTRCMEWLHATRSGEKGDRVPRFRVFRGRCENFIRTIPLQIRDKDNPEDLDTTLEDHAADDWRYALMSRPKPSGDLPPQRELPLTGWRAKLAKEHNLLTETRSRV